MVPHPIIVDFAIALLVVSVAFDALAAVVEERDLRVVAWWCLMLGTTAAALSVLSGYVAAGAAGSDPVVVDTVRLHRNLGLVTLACFVVCAAWRLPRPGEFPQRYGDLYWALAAAGSAALVITAYFGGVLVYRLGVGFVRPV